MDLTPNILGRRQRFVCSLPVLHPDMEAATEWSGPDRLAFLPVLDLILCAAAHETSGCTVERVSPSAEGASGN